MVGLDYARPGAQAYVDSIVSEFAAWGVDYIKLDGITNANGPDIEAWSEAIRQAGPADAARCDRGAFHSRARAHAR